MASDSDNKKEFTSILDLQKLQAENPDPITDDATQDPFAVNTLSAIEQVDHFDSIDQIGMMDHPEPTAAVELAQETPVENPFADDFKTSPIENDTTQEFINEEPAPIQELQPEAESESEEKTEIQDPFSIDFTSPAAAETIMEAPPVEFTSNFTSNIKSYSEQTQGKTNLEIKINYPFHLKINGTFGPFERDKLLLFITENPIGLSSSELDLQIGASRVFLPRISEYAAIKLVQELRDSGLTFSLQPSDREENESTNSSTSLSFEYQNLQSSNHQSSLSEIPILTSSSLPKLESSYQEIDEVSIVQFVRTEVMELENSPMIQEVIERMIEVLKQKARLKGGNALFSLRQEILPLRLPSQYQISLKASVIKI